MTSENYASHPAVVALAAKKQREPTDGALCPTCEGLGLTYAAGGQYIRLPACLASEQAHAAIVAERDGLRAERIHLLRARTEADRRRAEETDRAEALVIDVQRLQALLERAMGQVSPSGESGVAHA